MADKPRAGLPPPPGQQSAFARTLQGVKEYLGLGEPEVPTDPVAQTRITRTPVYLAGKNFNWPSSQIAAYSPVTKAMAIRPRTLQENQTAIPHESGHAIFDAGELGSKAVDLLTGQGGGIGYEANKTMNRFPELYPPRQRYDIPDQQSVEDDRWARMRANEGLAYSIGTKDGEPYIFHVANQLAQTDPKLAMQLIRLHHNALSRNSAVSK